MPTINGSKGQLARVCFMLQHASQVSVINLMRFIELFLRESPKHDNNDLFFVWVYPIYAL